MNDLVTRMRLVAYNYENTIELTDALNEAADRIERLESALSVYADCCDATETTPCGYEGNMCCMTARDAINEATK